MSEFLLNSRDCLQAISLFLNFLGAVILAIPLIKKERDLDDDLIIKDRVRTVGDKKEYLYTRRGFLKDRRYGLLGLGLLGLGFLIQFILVIL